MTKKFLVTGTWVDKSTGNEVSGIAEISQGINKNGHMFEIAATDRRETPIPGKYAVGTILSAAVSFGAEASEAEFTKSTQFPKK